MAFFSTTQDVEVVDPPTDSMSSIEFSPQVDFLAVGSWDHSVRVYEIGGGGQSQGKAVLQHTGPVLSVCWNMEGKVFSGGADGAGRMLDLATGQAMQIAQHDATIKGVKWVDTPGSGVLATGSWDKTIKFWDLRQAIPVATVNLPERCYAFDVQYPFMYVGTADRHVHIYNAHNLGHAYKSMDSPLRKQTRVLTCLPSANAPGFAIGSDEGRVAIRYVESKNQANDLTFKCHRRNLTSNSNDQSEVFPVNDITFHPIHETLSTVGSDGTVCFWDQDTHSRLKTIDNGKYPIASMAFNRNGSILAYAISYDWYKGYEGMVPGHPNKLMLHACKDEEVMRRRKK